MTTPAAHLVLITAPSHSEAETLARTLVEERLAACCNLVGGVRSIYRWQGDVESAEEVLIIVKSSPEIFERLERRVVELHSYSVPEILAVDLTAGSAPYLSWLLGSLDRPVE